MTVKLSFWLFIGAFLSLSVAPPLLLNCETSCDLVLSFCAIKPVVHFVPLYSLIVLLLARSELLNDRSRFLGNCFGCFMITRWPIKCFVCHWYHSQCHHANVKRRDVIFYWFVCTYFLPLTVWSRKAKSKTTIHFLNSGIFKWIS